MYELTRDKYLLPEELAQLQSRLDKARIKSPRNVTLIELKLALGCRSRELLNLRPEDFSRQDLSVYIRGIKNSRDRLVPIPQDLFNRCEALFVQGERVFPITTRRLRYIWEHYRPVNKGVHSLRHTAALRLYEKTKNVKTVQTFLGHRSLNNTMIYVDFVSNVEDLRKALVG